MWNPQSVWCKRVSWLCFFFFPPSACSRLRAKCKSVLLSSDALQGNPVSRVTISTAVIYSNSRACDSQVCVTFTRLWLRFWMREKYRVGVCQQRRRGAPLRFFVCVCSSIGVWVRVGRLIKCWTSSPPPADAQAPVVNCKRPRCAAAVEKLKVSDAGEDVGRLKDRAVCKEN